MRLIAAFALLCLSFTVHAQGTAELSWTPPTSYENGDPLDPATDLAEYRVYVNGELMASPAAGTQSFVVDELDYGTHEFTMTAVATNGLESEMSNVAVKEIPDERRPSPPNILEVILAKVLDVVRSIGKWFA